MGSPDLEADGRLRQSLEEQARLRDEQIRLQAVMIELLNVQLRGCRSRMDRQTEEIEELKRLIRVRDDLTSGAGRGGLPAARSGLAGPAGRIEAGLSRRLPLLPSWISVVTPRLNSREVPGRGHGLVWASYPTSNTWWWTGGTDGSVEISRGMGTWPIVSEMTGPRPRPEQGRADHRSIMGWLNADDAAPRAPRLWPTCSGGSRR
jgi:hypothetical protein